MSSWVWFTVYMNSNSTAALIARRGRKAMIDLPTYQEDILLALPESARAAISQEWTYRMNTEPGWRPSDLLRRCAGDFEAGMAFRSPVATDIAKNAGIWL